MERKVWNEKENEFLSIKLRVQDSIQRFLCVSEKIIEVKRWWLECNKELLNIYYDNFEDLAVELSRLWNEVMLLDESRKQSIFILVNFYIKTLPCKLKKYILDRLALDIIEEKINCSELVRVTLSLVHQWKRDL